MIERFFFNIWYKKSWLILAYLFLPLSAVYYVFWKLNNFIYNVFPVSNKLSCKVISIGNITVGGTGKTPFLLFLLEYLKEKNERIVVLTRGYKSKAIGEVDNSMKFSDEAMLIKSKNPDVMVIAGKERYGNFKTYTAGNPAPELVILDDGFQHRKITRDVDVVMVDGNLLFGNGFLFPAGPLREPVNSIRKRADVIVTKDADGAVLMLIKNLFPDISVFNFVVTDMKVKKNSGEQIDAGLLKNMDITAFCGIGNPMSFKTTLERFSIPVSKFLVFEDHINYKEGDIEKIALCKSEYYITTEKDAVKLNGLWKNQGDLLIAEPVFKIKDREWERYFL
jgi:tetraacyldisaccharide 4'-kinase